MNEEEAYKTIEVLEAEINDYEERIKELNIENDNLEKKLVKMIDLIYEVGYYANELSNIAKE